MISRLCQGQYRRHSDDTWRTDGTGSLRWHPGHRLRRGVAMVRAVLRRAPLVPAERHRGGVAGGRAPLYLYRAGPRTGGERPGAVVRRRPRRPGRPDRPAGHRARRAREPRQRRDQGHLPGRGRQRAQLRRRPGLTPFAAPAPISHMTCCRVRTPEPDLRTALRYADFGRRECVNRATIRPSRRLAIAATMIVTAPACPFPSHSSQAITGVTGSGEALRLLWLIRVLRLIEPVLGDKQTTMKPGSTTSNVTEAADVRAAAPQSEYMTNQGTAAPSRRCLNDDEAAEALALLEGQLADQAERRPARVLRHAALG